MKRFTVLGIRMGEWELLAWGAARNLFHEAEEEGEGELLDSQRDCGAPDQRCSDDEHFHAH